MNTNDTRDRILAMLTVGMTIMEIVADIERAERTVRYHVAKLRSEQKIFICGWQKKIGTGGEDAAIFKVGKGSDRRKPGREPRGVSQARHYRKFAALYRTRKRVQQGPPNVFAALMQGAR